MTITPRIAAVSVNHNTSAYMELMLRSLLTRQSPAWLHSVTVLDNGSTDDTTELRAFADRNGVPIVASGYTTDTVHNSHGEVLRQFVLREKDGTHLLFLDADVVFIEDDTVARLWRDLEARPDAFGIGPRLTWDGVNEIPQAARDANPDICDARLHPCCALIRNTPLFRAVVETVGLSCVKVLWPEREEYLDTFKLMTRVMNTHGLRHVFSGALVHHFFSVSYRWDTSELAVEKTRRRDAWLAEMRARDVGARPGAFINP